MENSDCTYEQAMSSISLFIEQFKSDNKMGFIGDIIILEYSGRYSLCLHLVNSDGSAMSMHWGLKDEFLIPYGIRSEAKREGKAIVARHRW